MDGKQVEWKRRAPARAGLSERGQSFSLLEALESRRLMSVTLDKGVLTVRGTPGDDEIVLTISRDNRHYVTELNGKRSAHRRGRVQTIRLLGGKGDDTLRISSRKTKLMSAKLVARGGKGADLFLGAAAKLALSENRAPVPVQPEQPTTQPPAEPLPEPPVHPPGGQEDPTTPPPDRRDEQPAPNTDPSEEGSPEDSAHPLPEEVPEEELNPPPPPAAPGDEGTGPERERLISWLTIGGSSPYDEDRRVGWNLKSDGWAGFVHHIVQPQIDWGLRRMVVFNPFGSRSTEGMLLDQYLHAQEEGFDYLTQGFVEAWRPVVESGIEVIAYLGHIGSPELWGMQESGDDAGWLERFRASIQPVLDAGMNLAVDAAVSAPADSLLYHELSRLRDEGLRVYVEARPAKTHAHWASFPIIAIDGWWKASDPANWPEGSNPWGLPNEVLEDDEVIRLINQPPSGRTWGEQTDWVDEYVAEILADGHTASMLFIDIAYSDVKYADLAAGATLVSGAVA